MKIHPKHYSYDTTILQSKTVGNICEALKYGVKNDCLEIIVKMLLGKRNTAINTKTLQSKGGLRSNKTTVKDLVKKIQTGIISLNKENINETR